MNIVKTSNFIVSQKFLIKNLKYFIQIINIKYLLN